MRAVSFRPKKGEKSMTYAQLKQKEIINTCDGARLGSICDLDLSPDGRILSLIVPLPFSFAGMFKGEGVVIPWSAVVMMGEDVILVNLPGRSQEGECKT
jgi:YlmC/YmxH family sporulation protein